MRAAVVIASAGRPALLDAIVANVDELEGDFARVVTVPDERSLPEAPLSESWTVLTGTRGLAAQRNAALEHLRDFDVVFFFDDDSVVRPDYVRLGMRFLEQHPAVVGLTGEVLLDGAVSGEVSEAAAAEELRLSGLQPRSGRWRRTRELYGCNFAVRLSSAPDIRFDPRLPLYSWLEDHDVARRLMRVGLLAHVDDCVIVHRAATSGGRQAHERLGYSQVMNPTHLWRERSFPMWLAVYEIFRPTAKNVALSIAGGQRSWRRRRLRGNLLAAADVLRGRITPERILTL